MTYESKIYNSDTELSKRYQALYDSLVPFEGNCETIEGETLRAFSRVGYRFFNDGDVFYRGYGCETAGPPHAFLVRESPLSRQLRPIFAKCEFGGEEAYERALDEAGEVIVSWVESKNGQYTPNTDNVDMFDSEAFFDEEDVCPDCGYNENECRCDEDEEEYD